MASQVPLNDDVGGVALLEAMNTAVARAHLKQAGPFASGRTCGDGDELRRVDLL